MARENSPFSNYAYAILTNNALAYWRLNETVDPSTNALTYDYIGGGLGSYGTNSLKANGPRPSAFPGFESTNTAVHCASCCRNTACETAPQRSDVFSASSMRGCSSACVTVRIRAPGRARERPFHATAPCSLLPARSSSSSSGPTRVTSPAPSVNTTSPARTARATCPVSPARSRTPTVAAPARVAPRTTR